MDLQALFADVVQREAITKGWSSDKKYKITDKNGQSYLLRISAPSTYEAKKTEFAMMEQ